MILNLEKINAISNSKEFVDEFLQLSLIAFTEARIIFEESLFEYDLDKYRQISHKLKTNLLLLQLSDLLELIESGKQKMRDLEPVHEFSIKLLLNIDLVIQTIKNHTT